MQNTLIRKTTCGAIRGIDNGSYETYLGIRYATADRFSYAKPVNRWIGEYDATGYGDACIQKRIWYEHLEIPERLFYHKEYREGISYSHSEDCLNLNIYTPKKPGSYPVIVFIHGGGFDSGCNYDTCIDGSAYPDRNIVFVSINYRVGIFGYFTHEQLQKEYGHDGNFGLDDQYLALQWVKEHISEFNGDSSNITVMGQSAGAISIQYLVLNSKCKDLFSHAIMLSGAGLFPKFALPKKASDTHEYWLDVMQTAGCTSFEDFKVLDAKKIYDALEEVKGRRKDNVYNTMPVIDGHLIEAPIDTLINHPIPIDYMIGYTNNDMFAIAMAYIGHKFAKATHAYIYYFDINAPGADKNGAFHSSDLRYVFGTLANSHRPYRPKDYKVSEQMISYIANFAKSGNPNGLSLPKWKPAGIFALCIPKSGRIHMGLPNPCKLLWNTLTKGDPK